MLIVTDNLLCSVRTPERALPAFTLFMQNDGEAQNPCVQF